MNRALLAAASLFVSFALACSTEPPTQGEPPRGDSSASVLSATAFALVDEAGSPPHTASSLSSGAPPAGSASTAFGPPHSPPGGTSAVAQVAASARASASAVESAPPPTVEGARRSGAEYAAFLVGPKRMQVGATVSLSAVFTASGRYHCNEKYPAVFKPDAAPEGISFSAEKFSGATFGEKRSALPVTLTASTAGTKTISGTLKFGVCDETECIPVKAPIAFTLAAE
jgi:hypothetical protein